MGTGICTSCINNNSFCCYERVTWLPPRFVVLCRFVIVFITYNPFILLIDVPIRIRARVVGLLFAGRNGRISGWERAVKLFLFSFVRCFCLFVFDLQIGDFSTFVSIPRVKFNCFRIRFFRARERNSTERGSSKVANIFCLCPART